ncbi:MAG: hypothetical protein SFW36_07430 [Leptolyngbyaceae cyanobacterium bins.59]|nr:hypothetical protein [Leptolyngbyaceae cyanobacterium bins.59]
MKTVDNSLTVQVYSAFCDASTLSVREHLPSTRYRLPCVITIVYLSRSQLRQSSVPVREK